MPKKVPLIDHSKPVKEYDLDDRSVRLSLGLPNKDPSYPQKISDRYVLYQNGNSAIVELKGSSTIFKAIRQLEATAKLFVEAGKKIDHIIIVAKKINRYERRLYRAFFR